MVLRHYYMALIGITIIIMGTAILLIHDPQITQVRNPEDIIWQERMRRNALEQLAPLRVRIHVELNQAGSILVSGTENDQPAIITMEPQERALILELLDITRLNVLESSDWSGEDISTAPESPPGLSRLYELKDFLWALTITYIDTIRNICSLQTGVFSSDLLFLEEQFATFTPLLEEELTKQGFGTVE